VGTGRPPGRPPLYTPELAQEICRRIASGETLKAICSDPKMPCRPVVSDWVLRDTDGFASLYARAKEQRAEVWADDLVEISDDGSRDYVDGEDGERRYVDHEHITRSRLRVDTRKWLMSKILPKQYGDRTTTELANADGKPLVVYNVNKTDSEL
jgi:hypothetical protein